MYLWANSPFSLPLQFFLWDLSCTFSRNINISLGLMFIFCKRANTLVCWCCAFLITTTASIILVVLRTEFSCSLFVESTPVEEQDQAVRAKITDRLIACLRKTCPRYVTWLDKGNYYGERTLLCNSSAFCNQCHASARPNIHTYITYIHTSA